MDKSASMRETLKTYFRKDLGESNFDGLFTSKEKADEAIEKYRTAMSHGAYPVSTNSVFHTVLDIAGVRTSVSDSTLALTNPAFAVRDRMFLGDHDEPVPFWKVGLKKADFVMLDKWKMAYKKD